MCRRIHTSAAAMVSLRLQKRLAASVLNCGLRKVWLDPNEVTDISMANSRALHLDSTLSGKLTPWSPPASRQQCVQEKTSGSSSRMASSSRSPQSFTHAHVPVRPQRPSRKAGTQAMVRSWFCSDFKECSTRGPDRAAMPAQSLTSQSSTYHGSHWQGYCGERR